MRLSKGNEEKGSRENYRRMSSGSGSTKVWEVRVVKVNDEDVGECEVK